MKKLPTIKCPDCGKTITRDDLRYAQEGTMYYKVFFDEKGEPNYEEDEFEAVNGGEFYHDDCGGTGLSLKELKKLGINY